jgi:hypothetical protein
LIVPALARLRNYISVPVLDRERDCLYIYTSSCLWLYLYLLMCAVVLLYVYSLMCAIVLVLVRVCSYIFAHILTLVCNCTLLFTELYPSFVLLVLCISLYSYFIRNCARVFTEFYSHFDICNCTQVFTEISLCSHILFALASRPQTNTYLNWLVYLQIGTGSWK